ncbi:glycoside hydrolase family 2 TIM barrel-domain containing protein [Salinimicrobium soli]|uniref:glycoside hydrolase family 2 TIM barrel-domain containing protein n=1 Tax=Salinimicrobium soli TaxID=1254399 RepID=UPI003AB0AFEF
MKSQLKSLILACLALTFFGCESLPHADEVRDQQQKTSYRTTENLNDDWQFRRLSDSLNSGWESVFLPHTIRIEPLVVNDQWQGEAVYKKEFRVNEISDRKWFFHFEGVMQEADVEINDSPVESHKGGYLPFTVDATPFLKKNSLNTITVRVRNLDNSTIPPGKPLEGLDFNFYGGIYRNVQLIKTGTVFITDPVHAAEVNSGGLLVHFDSISEANAEGFVKTHFQNDSEEEKEIVVETIFTSKDGRTYKFTAPSENVSAGSSLAVTQPVSIPQPDLWSPDSPALYDLKVRLFENGEEIDRKEIRTGIRDIFLSEDGFYLNGKRLFLNGTNRHQEYPFIGYALSDEANYRDAYKIKEAGFNFVRLSHYPQTTAFYEACDELGLLLMDCIPGWQYFGNEEFQERSLQDIRDMARRDRNHPSVVFWENSLNESGMTPEFIVKANEVLKKELPYEDTYSAGWIDHPAYDLFTPARQHAKPPYYWNLYNTTNRPILIAEYGDWEYYAQNAGFNQTAFSDLQEEERTSRQLRSAGEKRLLQQAFNFQEAFNSNLKGAQTIGMANWLMFDYNRGYSDDLEASGIADIFRIPKFSYYFYKSQKEPYSGAFSEPMVFIASYWTKGSSKKITVFSNTEEVALYLNGKLLAKKKPKADQFSDELPHPPFNFEVDEFEPGELKAEGFIDGKRVAEHVVRTPEKTAYIKLEADLSGKDLATTSPDVIFIYAKITDANGTLVPSANHPVTFRLEENENAELIGENPVNAEAGIASILLRVNKPTSDIVIYANSRDLSEATITIEK